jgi:hypothetical protein
MVRAVDGIQLRKHPYPFLCSLAICSDLDRCSFEDFVRLHLFLNTTCKTPFGEGLGLEMGDSFWMFSAGSRTDDAFSYFDGLTARPSRYADFIREGIQAGYIDCLHTYGHFSQYGGFRRRHAERALRELECHGLKVKVWVNHGELHNFQNILGRGMGDLPVFQQASGDLTPVEEYHTDMTLAYGIVFIWVDEVTDVIGQDRRYSIYDYLCDMKRRYGRELAIRAGMRVCVDAVKKKIRRDLVLPHYTQNNDLLRIQKLRDGEMIFTFQRFLPERRWGRDFGDDLRYTFSKVTMDTLEKNGGFMVAYVHLGKKRIPEILSAETVECLRELKERFKQRTIWVTTTSKLLTYNRVSRFLSWDVRKDGHGDMIITINGVNDPVAGCSLRVLEEYQGLTWYTPIPERTRVFLSSGQEVSVTRNPEDGTGRRSVSIPLSFLDPSQWRLLYHPC